MSKQPWNALNVTFKNEDSNKIVPISYNILLNITINV